MIRLIMMALAITFAAPQAKAEFNGHRFLGISANDQAAVIKQADGSLRLVRVGDRVGEEALLVGFDGEHVVLETAGEWGPVTLFVVLENGQQKVTRVERRPLVKYDFNRGEVGTSGTESQ